eukprot:7526666-Pyramimonas_sp.AAC.2
MRQGWIGDKIGFQGGGWDVTDVGDPKIRNSVIFGGASVLLANVSLLKLCIRVMYARPFARLQLASRECLGLLGLTPGDVDLSTLWENEADVTVLSHTPWGVGALLEDYNCTADDV